MDGWAPRCATPSLPPTTWNAGLRACGLLHLRPLQSTRLELEVAVALAGLVQAAALLDLAAYPLLRLGDLARGGQHVGQAAGRDYHHPVAVARDHVLRL